MFLPFNYLSKGYFTLEMVANRYIQIVPMMEVVSRNKYVHHLVHVWFLTSGKNVFPREMDLAKIERMRNRLGPQQYLDDNEANHSSNDDFDSREPTSNDVINKKSNSPPPEIIRNSNSPPRIQKPAAPKRPLPPFPVKNDEFASREKKETGPSIKKGKGSRGRPQRQQHPDPTPDDSDSIDEELKPVPKKPVPKGKQQPGGERTRRPQNQKNPSQKRPIPEEVEGANQSSPQNRNPGKKQKPTTEKPKLPSPGPSKFQNKKASKLAGPNNVSSNDEQENRAVTAAPKKQPQVAPNISQGAPKSRVDGSKARKQAKPDGSRHRKQGEAEDDLPGSERVAKDAVETAGAPKNRPGKSNNPKANNQATAKRPPPPKTQSGVGEETVGGPEAHQSDKNAGYFKWFRSDEKRPVDYARDSKGGWMNEFPATDEDSLPPTPPSSPIGLEKLPINQRLREQEERDAVQRELNLQNKKAAERGYF